MNKKLILPAVIGIVLFVALVVSICTVCKILSAKRIQGNTEK